MQSQVRVFAYKTGSYTPESADAIMRLLFDLCRSAEAKPQGTNTYFNAEKHGITFVFTKED